MIGSDAVNCFMCLVYLVVKNLRPDKSKIIEVHNKEIKQAKEIKP